MITKFSEFIFILVFEGVSASYSNTVTDPITGEQIDPHNWIRNKCVDCGMTRKLDYSIGQKKFYKYYDQMGLNRKGNLFCHPGSQKFLPSSDKPIRMSRTGDELNVKPLPKNTSLWDLTKLRNKPTIEFMMVKPNDLTRYLEMKRKYNLDYEFLMDSDDPDADIEELEKLEKILSQLRTQLLFKYKDNKDWIKSIKKLD